MIKRGFHSKAHSATAAASYARRAVLSQLLRYEQFEQFSISYVAALFKELRVQPEAAEVVEAAIRNTVAKGGRIELYYGSAAVGCRLFAIFRTLLVDQQSPRSLICRCDA